MGAVTHPRRPSGAGRSTTWWGKAWARTVEEAAYAEEDRRRGKRLATRGAVGPITVEVGGFLAAVDEGQDTHTVAVTVETIDEVDLQVFAELVAASSGRVAALLSGDLPLDLIEAAEEAGVELLPYAGELAFRCGCEAWMDPCPHALAVAQQVGWLTQADPFVLIQLRGCDREDFLARVHAASTTSPRGERASAPTEDPDLDAGLDAALRAARFLEADDDLEVEHLV